MNLRTIKCHTCGWQATIPEDRDAMSAHLGHNYEQAGDDSTPTLDKFHQTEFNCDDYREQPFPFVDELTLDRGRAMWLGWRCGTTIEADRIKKRLDEVMK